MFVSETAERRWAWIGILIILAFLIGVCSGCAPVAIHTWMPQVQYMTALEVRSIFGFGLFLLFVCGIVALMPGDAIDVDASEAHLERVYGADEFVFWTCLACRRSCTEPDWSDTSEIDRENPWRTTHKHLAACPYCYSLNMQPPRAHAHYN